jgi:hypothetical protein
MAYVKVDTVVIGKVDKAAQHLYEDEVLRPPIFYTRYKWEHMTFRFISLA